MNTEQQPSEREKIRKKTKKKEKSKCVNRRQPENLFHVSHFTIHFGIRWHAYLSNRVTFRICCCVSNWMVAAQRSAPHRIAEHERAKQNAMLNINFNFLREKNSFVMTYETNLTTTSAKYTHTHTHTLWQALTAREIVKMCSVNDVRGDARVLFTHSKRKCVTLLAASIPHAKMKMNGWEQRASRGVSMGRWWWRYCIRFHLT